MNIKELAPLVLRRRGNMGVRAAAQEIGISPTTLTRIEKGHVPDVATLDKLSAWLGEEATKFTGVGDLQIAFKNRKAVPQQTAHALAELITKAAQQFEEEVEARGH
ncbi:MAG: helix-turn-helix transcriptional regulator [Pseudomonadota bacterium]